MNKETKNTIVFLVVLVAVFGVVDFVFGKAAQKLLFGMPAAPNELARRNYVINRSDEECLILGSSRAAHHYNPSIIQDSLNLTVYNAGLDGHGISYADGVIKARIQRSLPSLIILECSSIELQHSWLSSINSLKPYYSKYPSILEFSQSVNGNNEKIKSKFAFYRFNSTLLPMIKTYFSKQEDKQKGFVPLDNSVSKVIVNDIQKESSIERIDSVSNIVLADFIATCKNRGINLVICYSPILGNVKDEAMLLSNRFQELDVPFLDFSDDSTFINHPNLLFKDNTHLNKDGADIYSRIVAHKIKGILAQPL